VALHAGPEPACHPLLEQFVERLDSHDGPARAGAEQEVCPSCKAPLEPEQEECPICAKVLYTPPSTWTLFRLWRFAHPTAGQLAWASC
jgi:ATP-binding cassette subfamily B protein